MIMRRAARRWPMVAVVAVLWLGSLISLVGCDQGTNFEAQQSPGASAQAMPGDPRRGQQLITAVGCHTCHTVPGVRTADATVGPPLDFWSERMYIAGRLLNSRDNTVAWVLGPQSVEPGTAMPDMNLDATQAHDITAFLYTLRRGRTR